VNLVRREWLRETAHLRLRQLLDLPPDAKLDLTSRVDVDAEPTSVAQTAADAAGVTPGEEGERFAVRQADASVTISRNARAIARSQWFPSINANASYGWTSYPNGIFPEIDPDRWNRNVSAGVTMTLPIFNGGRILGNVEKAGADVTEAEARQQQAVELTDLDTRDANLQLEAARAQWVATSGTVDQARRAYEISEIRYREGVSTQLELADSRLLLAVALANRAQAARDLQVARIRVALLPVLPVQLGTTASAVNAELGAGGATNF
jgi:outer membrane protein TolC